MIPCYQKSYKYINNTIRLRYFPIIFYLFFVLCITSVIAYNSKPVADRKFNEYQVKAVFSYNVLQFISWPQDWFDTDRSPFEIGIFGQDPFGPYLEATIKDETINGRPIIITHHDNFESATKCQVLFVSKSINQLPSEIISQLGNRKILIMGEKKRFIKNGGHINLLLKRGRIQIEVNLNSVKRIGLKISSKLLKIVKIIDL